MAAWKKIRGHISTSCDLGLERLVVDIGRFLAGVNTEVIFNISDSKFKMWDVIKRHSDKKKVGIMIKVRDRSHRSSTRIDKIRYPKIVSTLRSV